MATSSKHEQHIEARTDVLKVLDTMPKRAKEPIPPWACRIMWQFGLSPSETRMALAVADGKGAKAAAKQLGLSYHTARGQLKIVFDKTDTRGQTSLAVLVARMEPR